MTASPKSPSFAADVYRQIAREYTTPCYIYDANRLTENYRQFQQAFAGLDVTICFAVKANGNLAVLRELAGLGAGADIVSQGEMIRAQKAGMRPIIFSGVGKSLDELRFAIEHGAAQINIESEAEFDMLCAIAADGAQPVKFAVRVNPDVDAQTHDKIATGRKSDKFGLDFAQAEKIYRTAKQIPNLIAHGAAVHIGSQLLSLDPYREAFARLKQFIDALAAQDIILRAVDLGGGLGVCYRDETPPDIADYAALVKEFFADFAVMLEPGRRIAADAGELLCRVIAVKTTQDKKFAIVDAGMNDLLRPTLYQAHHEIVGLNKPDDSESETYDVVGPVCESGDRFAEARLLPRLEAGDLLIIKDCGAYGAVMASSYNARALPAELMVKDGVITQTRRAVTVEDLLAFETIA